jgi:hypothetical protein
MPIPVIVWATVAGGTALVGFVKTRSSICRVRKAKERYAHRRRSYEAFIRRFSKKHRDTSKQFDELGEIRLTAMSDMGNAVDFLERARLKERDLFEAFNITPEKLIEWKKASVHAGEVMGGLASSALSGAATAAGVYGLVGLLASASTGTAISTLSGAAATNATLAWLGGGSLAAGGGGIAAGTAVLGGLVVGPALAVVGFVAGLKASKIERQVEKHVSELDIDEAEKKKVIAVLDAVMARVNEIHETTVKTQAKLREALRGAPENLEDAYMVAKIASALGKLLEIKILDDQGGIVGQKEE